VRHATPDDLVELGDLLTDLRALDGLVEKRPGVFYRRSRAFLHFHADPAGLFADVRFAGDDFERRPVHTPAQRDALLRDVLAALEEKRPKSHPPLGSSS
jgi:hypothetical protein